MDKCFCLGLAVGMLAGAVIASNSYKLRRLVTDSQKQVKEEVEKMTEEKDKQTSAKAHKE